MSRRINYAKLLEIQNDLAAGRMDVARDGGFFCTACQRITELAEESEQMRCAICGLVTVKVLQPVAWDGQPATVRPAATVPAQERMVPVNEAHARFEAMKAGIV